MATEKPARDRLTNDDYLNVQQQIQIFGGAIAVLDLEAFIDRANHADAVAPFIDPTAWREAKEKLAAIRDLAEGALKFKLASVAFQNTMHRLDAAKAKAAETEPEKEGGP